MNRPRIYSVALSAALFAAACGGGANRYVGVAPAELFLMATSEFEDGDHANAIQVLDRILITHGDWERIPEARLMLGDVYFERGDYLTARSEYTRFLDRYAGHPASPDAALGICKSLAALAPSAQRDQGYTQEAMASCRNVVTDYPGQQQSADAARISNDLRIVLAEKDFRNGDFYFRRKLFDAALMYYEFVADLYPETEFAPQALLGMYYCNQEFGYQDLADEVRDRLFEQYPDSESAAVIRAATPNG